MTEDGKTRYVIETELEELTAEEAKKIALSKYGHIKKMKKPKVNGNYPTRCKKVGEIYCLFLSCFHSGRSPFISIGPSWPFTFALLFIAGLVTTYFTFFLMMVRNTQCV